MSPYTALIRRAGNPFEIAHVLVSWLIGAMYDAYVVVGCAKRDTCLNLRYRQECPDVPDETEVVHVEPEPEEEPRYKLVPLPDFNSKYVKMMEDKAAKKIQDELDRIETEKQLRIKELELPPKDEIDGWRTHAWVLILPGPMGVEKPFFIEPSQGNAYPLDYEQYQQIDSIYNNENYYVNLQTLVELDEEEWEPDEFIEKELVEAREREEREKHVTAKTEEEAIKRKEYEEKLEKDAAQKEKERLEAKDEALQEQRAKDKKKEEHEDVIKKSEGVQEEIEELKHKTIEERERLAAEKEAEEKEGPKKKRKKKKKKIEEEKVEEEVAEEEQEERKVVWQNLSHLSYDLNNIKLWEHLLPGEPFHRRQFIGMDYGDKRTAVDTEKHLDMPASWVEKLDITAADFEQRYPGFHKQIHYKKVLVDKYSRYSQPTGVVKKITVFEDYALTKPLITYEYYENRDDKMNTMRLDHNKKWVKELFDTGRPDHLLKHEYSLEAPPESIEGDRTMEFKWYSRLDHLEKIVCTPLTFEEFYVDRRDLLVSRHIEYSEPTKADHKRQLIDVTEVYKRNYSKPAKEDVWKRIFHISNNAIELLYHYEYNFVTNDNRHYIKPNLAETGGKVLFYPDKTSGYIADPCGQEPRPLDVYMGLVNNMQWEHETNKHVREYESDISSYLRQRYKELTEPTLYISLFNTEQNKVAQEGYAEQERLKAEIAHRETEADADPLQPYIARMFGVSHGLKHPLTIKEASMVRDQCINDFKATQLARQLLVQERFDKFNAEYKAKRLWYLANQFILTPEKEAAYFTMSADLSFSVHTLEVRLSRHRDLSAPRYRALEAYLNKHPLLVEYNRMKNYYRFKV
ncbi:dynein regulatory complex subunit 7 [Phthorimaea operculella]|nr:dynein regulatory complex subunit 7 [Phthorimaea operculella]